MSSAEATKTGHTPGPWHCDPTVYFVEGPTISYRHIARINTFCPEYEANARLIAVAPELLAALKELLATRNTHFPHSDAEVRAFEVVRAAEGRS